MSGTDDGKEASAADIPAPPAPAPGEENVEPPAETAVDEDTIVADFDPGVWDPTDRRYGKNKLFELRQAMLPIADFPKGMFLKYTFLHIPGHGEEQDGDADQERRERRAEQKERTAATRDRNKGKGKGKQQGGGRFVPEMGKTELQPDFVKGQWWRNVTTEHPVVVRDGFSLMSQEIWKVPCGHYVQQAGPAEIFVSGQAKGLMRMPIYPRGWVTADASTVGGPKYLDAVTVPRWQVSFKSATSKGDILVRESLSLESDEVGCILDGSFVTQSGPQETLEDGIIRMPISWHESSSASGPAAPKKCSGWVTCDASSQGGPKFFTAVPEEAPRPIGEAAEADRPDASASHSTSAAGGERRGQDAFASWDKNRTWRVANLDPSKDRSLPIVTRSDPYAPGTGRVPPEDLLVRWLANDEIVEQIGHSKKTRGYMVMPIRVVRDAKGEEVKDVEGWVTRRSVDKQRENSDGAWLIEMRDDDEDDREKRRRARREQRGS